MVNQVDGANNPLGKVFSRKELCLMLSGVHSIKFETGCTFFHCEDKLPIAIKQLIIKRFGWHLYVKGIKSA